MPRGGNPNSKKSLMAHQHKFNSETASAAGKRSAEMKNRRKTFREEFELELSAIIRDNNGKETTVKNAITKTAIQKALKGDLRAIELVRDTIGEKPAENIVLFEADPNVIVEVETMVYGSP